VRRTLRGAHESLTKCLRPNPGADRVDGVSEPYDWDGPGWYRFTGEAGTQMSETILPPWRCGALATGYLTEPHPVADDGVVDRTACFSWINDSCLQPQEIGVVHCGDHYLYNLVNVTTNGRYCGIDLDPGPADCVATGDCLPSTCQEALQADPEAETGVYTLAGEGDIADFDVYCDMDTDDGGWTLLWSNAAANDEEPMTSDTPVFGNPFSDDQAEWSYNLTRAQKVLLHSRSSEGNVVRASSGEWLRFDAPPFGALLEEPDSDENVSVRLTEPSGLVRNGWIGYSNFNITGGGDFSVGQGRTITDWRGVTNFSTQFRNLNANCAYQYLYSFSNAVHDSDGAYRSRLTFGDWQGVNSCTRSEGGGLALRLGVR